MKEKDKKKIYEAARNVCLRAVNGFDAEIDYDNLEEIVDEELITVIDNISYPAWIPTDEHIHRMENPIELVEDEYGEYDDNLSQKHQPNQGSN
jgi:hypothetical protein